jgi:hypothetical protein
MYIECWRGILSLFYNKAFKKSSTVLSSCTQLDRYSLSRWWFAVCALCTTGNKKMSGKEESFYYNYCRNRQGAGSRQSSCVSLYENNVTLNFDIIKCSVAQRKHVGLITNTKGSTIETQRSKTFYHKFLFFTKRQRHAVGDGESLAKTQNINDVHLIWREMYLYCLLTMR